MGLATHFFARTNLATYQRRALDTHPKGRRPARPHELTCVGHRSKSPRQRKTLASQPPSLRGAPGCQPRDTATGTTPPLAAGLERWKTHSPRTSVPATPLHHCSGTTSGNPSRGAHWRRLRQARNPGAGTPRRYKVGDPLRCTSSSTRTPMSAAGLNQNGDRNRN